MGKKALTGVKVLENSRMVAGPYCAKMLADFGAEVIKIEKPGVGDAARNREPFLDDIPHPERSGLFLYLNTNKLGVTLDMASQAGRNIFLELVKQTDILVEDTLPREQEKLDLGYDTLKTINPKLVMASVTTFGQTGPNSNFRAHPINTFQAGGEGYLTPAWMDESFRHRQPLKEGKYVGDYEGAISAAVAAMGALFYQRATGKGQHVDLSIQQALTALNMPELSLYPNQGFLASRWTRTVHFGGIIPCKDGYMELALYEEHQWQGLLKLMGNPEWANAEKFADRLSRAKNGKVLNGLIGNWMKDYTKEEIYHKGQSLGCPIAPYNSPKDVVESRQNKARKFFIELDHPEAGKLKYPSEPSRFSETHWGSEFSAPLLGQHNEEIFCHRLGYSQRELVKLRGAGVI